MSTTSWRASSPPRRRKRARWPWRRCRLRTSSSSRRTRSYGHAWRLSSLCRRRTSSCSRRTTTCGRVLQLSSLCRRVRRPCSRRRRRTRSLKRRPCCHLRGGSGSALGPPHAECVRSSRLGHRRQGHRRQGLRRQGIGGERKCSTNQRRATEQRGSAEDGGGGGVAVLESMGRWRGGGGRLPSDCGPGGGGDRVASTGRSLRCKRLRRRTSVEGPTPLPMCAQVGRWQRLCDGDALGRCGPECARGFRNRHSRVIQPIEKCRHHEHKALHERGGVREYRSPKAVKSRHQTDRAAAFTPLPRARASLRKARPLDASPRHARRAAGARRGGARQARAALLPVRGQGLRRRLMVRAVHARPAR